MNPAQIIEFIGSNFDKKKDADNIEDVQYTLTVHDLLSAFSDFDPCSSCKNFDASKVLNVHAIDCLECSYYYGSKWRRNRDLKILMAHYYRETPDQIAARI